MNHTLNKKSWHFWLATKVGPMSYYPGKQVNICSYIRNVLAGLGALILTIISFGGLIGLYFLGGYELIVWALENGMSGSPPDISFLFLFINIIAAAIAFGIVLLYTCGKIHDYKQMKAAEPERQPSFISLAFRKWKEKKCFFVEFSE